MTLFSLGWNEPFARSFEQLGLDQTRPARVLRQDKQRYLVRDETGTYTAHLLGKMLYQEPEASSLPAVGDWVAHETFDEDQSVIHAVLPRFSVFLRKQAGTKTQKQVLAANIDTVFLVSGLDHDFNLRRIERYLLQASDSGARPIIVLNKEDVCDDVDARVHELTRVIPDVPYLLMSAHTGKGMEALRTHIAPGQTVVFVGSSGVGKSTIVNTLVGEDQQATQAVREDDSRGRHTTTHRELFVLPGGGILIDTPGLRELQLWVDASGLETAFADIEAYAADCRFADCSHEVEPGCAVQEALAEGYLDADRFKNYLKLRREVAYLERQQHEAAQRQERRRDKQFGKLMKSINRHNPKRDIGRRK